MNEMTPDEKAEINAKLDKIIEAIYGNGKPGMVTRLALLEKWQADHDKAQTQSGNDFRSLVIPLATDALKAAAAGGAFVVIGHLLGILH